MKYTISAIALSLTVNLSISTKASAGFLDDMVNMEKAISKEVKSLEKLLDSDTQETNTSNTKTNKKNSERNTKPTTSASSSGTNKKGVTVKGSLWGKPELTVLNRAYHPGSPTLYYSVRIQLNSTNSSNNIGKNCYKYIHDQFVLLTDSKKSSSRIQEFQEKFNSQQPSVELSNVRTTNVKNECLFSGIKSLGIDKKPAKLSTTNNTPSITLASVTDLSEVKGMLMSNMRSRKIPKNGLKILLTTDLPEPFKKNCSTANTYHFYPSSKHFTSGTLPKIIRKGLSTTITDASYSDGKCYFATLILGEAVDREERQQQIKSNKLAVRSENETMAFAPKPNGKSDTEGNMLIGTVESIDSLREVPTGYKQKMKIAVFQLSNVVTAAKKPYSCSRYLPDAQALGFSINVIETAEKYNSRVRLLGVRPSKRNGECIYQSMEVLDKDLNPAAKLTQADVSVTPAALLKDKQAILSDCKTDRRLNQRHRCGCLSEKYVQARKLFLNKNEVFIRHTIRNQCINIAGYTTAFYKDCLSTNYQGSQTPTTKNLCYCAAKELEKTIISQGLEKSSQDRYKGNAYITCSNK